MNSDDCGGESLIVVWSHTNLKKKVQEKASPLSSDETVPSSAGCWLLGHYTYWELFFKKKKKKIWLWRVCPAFNSGSSLVLRRLASLVSELQSSSFSWQNRQLLLCLLVASQSCSWWPSFERRRRKNPRTTDKPSVSRVTALGHVYTSAVILTTFLNSINPVNTHCLNLCLTCGCIRILKVCMINLHVDAAQIFLLLLFIPLLLLLLLWLSTNQSQTRKWGLD